MNSNPSSNDSPQNDSSSGVLVPHILDFECVLPLRGRVCVHAKYGTIVQVMPKYSVLKLDLDYVSEDEWCTLYDAFYKANSSANFVSNT